MTNTDKIIKSKPGVLRQAEEALRGQHIEMENISPEEAQRLVHELQVRQIELAAQNEELRAAQLALEASHRQYIDLYDFAPIGYLTISASGLILEANLTCSTLLGVEVEGIRIGFVNCGCDSTQTCPHHHS